MTPKSIAVAFLVCLPGLVGLVGLVWLARSVGL